MKASVPSSRNANRFTSSAETNANGPTRGRATGRDVNEHPQRSVVNSREAAVPQDRVAAARHRGRAARGWRHRAEVEHPSDGVCGAYSSRVGALGEAGAGAHLAGAARRGPAVAQGQLRRSQAHRRWSDASLARPQSRRRPPGRNPLRQFDRTRADDAGRDAGAPARGAGVPGLLADESGSRQAEIPFWPHQTRGGDGAGRTDVRESAARARPHRRQDDPRRTTRRGDRQLRL